jgi:hypothetical protein
MMGAARRWAPVLVPPATMLVVPAAVATAMTRPGHRMEQTMAGAR